MERKIMEYARDKQVIVGICDAERLEDLAISKERLEAPFVPEDIEIRMNPKRTMPTAKSVIVVGMGYRRKEVFKDDGCLRGNISVGAVGTDYHIVLKQILAEMVDHLLNFWPFDYKIFVDNGPLMERELAKKAGLGYTGKSCNLISSRFGSFFYIGYVMTDLALESSKKTETCYTECGACNHCIQACPGQALGSEQVGCDYQKCVSYLTQYKGILRLEQMKTMGLQIYGCDICQSVCPKNARQYVGEIKKIDASRPDLLRLLSMTNQEFKQVFKETAAGWRGKKLLKRNALVALGNCGDAAALEILRQYIRDEDEMIRHTAENAIKILETQVYTALEV